MATRRPRALLSHATSDNTPPKRHRGAVAAPSRSPVAAAPATAAAAAAAAAQPAGESRTTLTPADLYTKGLRYLDTDKFDDAMHCFRRAAKSNHIEAALRYAGMLLHRKLGSEADVWYTRALDLAKGHANEPVLSARAYYGIGIVAFQGLCGHRAFAHFHQGALLSHAECQYQVGVYLDKGYVGPRDVAAAYYWLRLADAGGSHHAADSLGLPCLPSPLSLSDTYPLLF